MGFVKEPEGVDFIVGPNVLTKEDNTSIRQAIAAYKRNRRKKTFSSGKVVLTTQSKIGYVAAPTFVTIQANDGKFHKIAAELIKSKESPWSSKTTKRKNKRA